MINKKAEKESKIKYKEKKSYFSDCQLHKKCSLTKNITFFPIKESRLEKKNQTQELTLKTLISEWKKFTFKIFHVKKKKKNFNFFFFGFFLLPKAKKNSRIYTFVLNKTKLIHNSQSQNY